MMIYLFFFATACSVQPVCNAWCNMSSTAIPRLSFLKQLISSSVSMSSMRTILLTNSYLAYWRHKEKTSTLNLGNKKVI